MCDDPRHENHLQPVDTFVRLGSAAAGHTGEPVSNGEWISESQLSALPMPTGWRDHYQSGDLGELVHSYRCVACPPRNPQQFEVTHFTLQWVLNAVAEQGISRPTVRIINLLLSKRTK